MIQFLVYWKHTWGPTEQIPTRSHWTCGRIPWKNRSEAPHLS